MSKAQQLKVEIVDDRLVISVGVGLAAFAVQTPDATDWPDDYYISDPAVFATEIVRALEDEEEDGTTLVHRMLDAAAVTALENGALGAEEGPVEKGIKIAKRYMGDK